MDAAGFDRAVARRLRRLDQARAAKSAAGVGGAAQATAADRQAGESPTGAGHHVEFDRSGAGGGGSAVAAGKRAADAAPAVPAYLVETYRAISAELVSDDVPAALAKGVCQQAAALHVTDVVQALEKCQAMALRLKAAKFLNSNTTNDIQALRAYAERLVLGETTE